MGDESAMNFLGVGVFLFEIDVIFRTFCEIGSDLLGVRARRSSKNPPSTHSIGDNECIRTDVQNTMTSEVRFRAELSEYGVKRLELARA